MEQERAVFVERPACINCGSPRLKTLSEGVFGEEPLRSFIENDPWGESPMPHIAHQRWVFVRCADCAQMFHRHVLSPAWNERRFSEWMTEEAMRQFLAASDTPENAFNEGRRHVGHVLRIERLTRPLRAHQAVSLLDFGCGWGEFLSVCEGFGFFCCGVDRSPARRQNGRAQIFAEIEHLKSLPAAARGFHAITLFEVLEHLDDPLSVLKALSDLLVPKGVLVLETPNCAGVSNIRTESDYRKTDPLDHINAFTPETLCSMAARAGFEPIGAGVAHVTSNPVQLAKTLIKRMLRPVLKPTTQQYFRKVR